MAPNKTVGNLNGKPRLLYSHIRSSLVRLLHRTHRHPYRRCFVYAGDAAKSFHCRSNCIDSTICDRGETRRSAREEQAVGKGVMGLPFSMFWVVLWILVEFVGFIVAYNWEYRGR